MAFRLKTTRRRSFPVASSQANVTIIVRGIDQVVMACLTFYSKLELFLDGGPQLLLALL
jgi:hypothetical protein